MKTKLLTLLMALFAFAESANAYFTYNGFIIYFSAGHDMYRNSYEYKYNLSDVPKDLVIEDPVKSLKFDWLFYLSYDFHDKEELTELKLWYTVYNTLEGGQNCVWKSHDIPLDQQSITYYDDTRGTGYIRRYYFPGEDGLEIIKEERLSQNVSKTVLFYFEGKDKEGRSHYCKNGEEYFKLSFKIGEGPNRIMFSEQETSHLLLDYYVNREERHPAYIYFNGDGSFSTEVPDGVMPAPDDFGEISSLYLCETNIGFYRAEGLELNDIDASFMYKVYEEGHGNEVDWNKLDFVEKHVNYGNHVVAAIYNPDGNNLTNLAEGLELNKNYVFEVYYQVMVGKECYTLGKNENEGTKFKFTTRTAQIIEGPIKSLMLAYSLNNNDVVYQEMPESEFPEVILQEPISSFKIYGGEAVTDDRIQNLELLTTVIEENSPAFHGWRVIPFTDNGFGMWTIELPKPEELMMERWQDEHKRITYVLTVEGTDQNGNPVTLDNGGEGYKFTFTCCPDTARGIKDFRLRVDANGEEGPLDMPVSGAEWAQLPIPLYSFKILKAEANTYKPMKSVTFFYTLFNTADGVSFDQDAWMTSDLVHQGNNYWAIDIHRELIDEEWILQNLKTNKTFQFFLRAEDEEGDEYFFNNDDKFYIFSFNLDDADGINEIESGNLKVEKEETIFNLAGQRLQKPQKGINIIGGKKMLVK